MSKTFSYGRKEKLKSRKWLTQLFEKKQSFSVYPIRVFYLAPGETLDHFIKAGVGVNSRNFRKAVQRNRIKRLLREAYRLNKLPLLAYLQQKEKQIVVFFLYVDKTVPDGKWLQTKMPAVISELIKRLDESIAQTT